MSAAVAAAAAAANISYKSRSSNSHRRSNQAPKHFWVPFYRPSPRPQQPVIIPRESQKVKDWNAFRQYLKKHRPGLILSRCIGVDVIEFLNYQSGNIKTHARNCPFFGNSDSPSQSPGSCSCSCPLRLAWSSLDGLVGRLRVAFEENGGRSDRNPFSSGVVMVYISQVKAGQA